MAGYGAGPYGAGPYGVGQSSSLTGTATLVATSDLSATPVMTQDASTTIAATSAVGIAGSTLAQSGSLTITSTSVVLSHATTSDINTAVMVATSAMSAGVPSLSQDANTTIFATSDVSATPTLAVFGATTIAATTSMTAGGAVSAIASVTFGATSALTAQTPTLAQQASAAMIAIGTVTAHGTTVTSATGSAVITATSDMSALAALAFGATVTITATSDVTAHGTAALSPGALPAPATPPTLTLTVTIAGIVTPVRSVRTAHDVDQPIATGSLTMAAPKPYHVECDASVTIHAGRDGDALPIFTGRIPEYDGAFSERGGEVTVALEGVSRQLWYSHPTWLGFQGPEPLHTWWRSVCAYVGIEHFFADYTQDVDGNTLFVGANPDIHTGIVLIDNRSSPGAGLSRVARLFGYRHFDTPTHVRLQRVSGLPTQPVGTMLTYVEGVNARSFSRREALDPMINYWDVWGASYTAADTSEVVIHSAPATVPPDDRLGPFGVARDEVRDAALDTIDLADACRNAHEVDYSEPYSRWRWSVRGDAARIPGEQVALDSPKVGEQIEVAGVLSTVPAGVWVMRVEHDISDRGWTTTMEGWQGAGQALPAANDCATQTLLTGARHLGNQTLGYYRRPTPDGTTITLPFSVTSAYTTMTVRGFSHGTNAFSDNVTSTASRFELWQSGSRVGSGDLPVTGEDGGADYTQDAPWHAIVVPLSGTLLFGTAELRIIAGEDTDVGDVDDFEIRDVVLATCGVGIPGNLTDQGFEVQP